MFELSIDDIREKMENEFFYKLWLDGYRNDPRNYYNDYYWYCLGLFNGLINSWDACGEVSDVMELKHDLFFEAE